MALRERQDYLMGLLVYECVNGIAPSYLRSVLMLANSVQSRGSRSSDKIYYTCRASTATFLNNCLGT